VSLTVAHALIDLKTAGSFFIEMSQSLNRTSPYSSTSSLLYSFKTSSQNCCPFLNPMVISSLSRLEARSCKCGRTASEKSTFIRRNRLTVTPCSSFLTLVLAFGFVASILSERPSITATISSHMSAFVYPLFCTRLAVQKMPRVALLIDTMGLPTMLLILVY